MGTNANASDPKGHERGSAEEPKVVPRSAEALNSLIPNRSLRLCEVSEWIYLNEGERVVVERAGMHPQAGYVDVISDDAYVFWVLLDNGKGRIMISAQESGSVWRFPTG